MAESVEVTATLETLNRTSAEVGGLIEAEQIKEIPVSGRNWASLMLLAPGAVNYSDGSQRNIRFNGHSIDDANYTFDGIDNNGVQEQTQKAETRLNIALDSIAEFRVSTAVYTAESGAAGGVQVQVVSKTGTNQFHGSTFYSLRNDALDARSPFDGADHPAVHAASVRRQLRRPDQERQGILLHELRRPAAGSGNHADQLRAERGISRQGDRDIAGAQAADGCLSGRTDAPRRHHRPDQPGGQQSRCAKIPG